MKFKRNSALEFWNSSFILLAFGGILGDPLYGLCKDDIERILGDKMSEKDRILKSGANLLMLHANALKFTFKGQKYHIKPQMES